MLIVRLPWKTEPRQRFIEIFRVVNDEIVAFGLTGEESIDGFGSQPFFMNGFALHLIKARIELSFELVPFCAVSVFRTPGEAIEFVDVEMLKHHFKWHVVDNAHAKF